jgi:hypothetical protein
MWCCLCSCTNWAFPLLWLWFLYTVMTAWCVCQVRGKGRNIFFMYMGMFSLGCQKRGYMLLCVCHSIVNDFLVNYISGTFWWCIIFVLFVHMRNFHSLVYQVACMSGIKYMLCKFWIALISSYGLIVYIKAGFKCASILSYIFYFCVCSVNPITNPNPVCSGVKEGSTALDST